MGGGWWVFIDFEGICVRGYKVISSGYFFIKMLLK